MIEKIKKQGYLKNTKAYWDAEGERLRLLVEDAKKQSDLAQDKLDLINFSLKEIEAQGWKLEKRSERKHWGKYGMITTWTVSKGENSFQADTRKKAIAYAARIEGHSIEAME